MVLRITRAYLNLTVIIIRVIVHMVCIVVVVGGVGVCCGGGQLMCVLWGVERWLCDGG